jgi:hypothetical protein
MISNSRVNRAYAFLCEAKNASAKSGADSFAPERVADRLKYNQSQRAVVISDLVKLGLITDAGQSGQAQLTEEGTDLVEPP